MYSAVMKVNGKDVPLNEQMKSTLFETIAGFTRSLKGVDVDVKSIEIQLEQEE